MDCMASAELIQHHVPMLGQAPSKCEKPGGKLELSFFCIVCREE